MNEPESPPPAKTPPADYHRTPSRSFWPEPDEYAEAKAALGAQGRFVNDYLRACLRWLNASPEAALETLQSHWPPPRRPGRPRGRGAAAPPGSPAEQAGSADQGQA
ncbi:hypothetical protein [Amycolatopsis sp. NPDC051903]|uniref:hypothetical protein n=1 Tax=Amycolatopsis sp. NPDC051903 TaxID=3363936 RepID=UPI0037ACEC41